MKLRVLACVLGLGMIWAGSSVPAHAQADDVDAARSHFKTGVDYYRDGDLSAALIEFKRAYAAAPSYRLLYNLGQVSHELRDYSEAQRYFEDYLKQGAGEIDASRKQEVETALAKIRARIASVVLSCNLPDAEYFVDDVSVGHSPMVTPVRVNAGTRRISAAVRGRPRVTEVVEAAGGDTLVVKLEFSALASEALPAAPPRAAGRVTESSGPGPALWLGLGSGALAVGTGVMAYLAYADGANYRDALDRKTSAHELDALHDGATSKALVTDVLLAATLISTAITVVVAFSDTGKVERPQSARAEPTAQLKPRSFALTGHFE